MTGEVKFNPKSTAYAEYVLSSDSNGDVSHLYKSTNKAFLNKVAQKANVTVRFKSTSIKSKGVKTGEYKYWSVVALGVKKLEEEIESTVGRLKYLNDLVGYSTLDLILTKKKDFKYDPEGQDSFIERLKQSFSNGWNSFVNFILLLFRLWPVWLILPVLISFIRKYRRKIKK